MAHDGSSRLTILHLLCGAILASLGLHGLVLHLVTQGRAPVAVPPAVPVVLGALGASSLLAATLLGRAVRKRAGADRDRGLFVGTLVAFALRDSCSIMGLVLAFLTMRPLWYVAFAAPAAVAMLLGWPRASDEG